MGMSRALFPALLLLVCGCVERRLLVRTDPPGALVRINGAEVGKSPAKWRYDHYGTVLVEADLEGYEPARRVVRLATPWYEQPGLDFLSDVVIPARIRDEREVALTLSPLREMTAAEVEERMERLARSAAERRAESQSEAEAKKEPCGSS